MGCRTGRSQIVRLLQLWRYLQGRQVVPRIDELMEEFHVSRRVIYRDLRVLKEAGERVPVSWYHEGRD
jgi:predicted DNA-binding transcriptional regulator YafY